MSNYILDPKELLIRVFLAIFLGVLIGIDRDESWQPNNATIRSRFTFIKPGKHAAGLGGVRTYIILALFGLICGLFYVADPRTLPLIIVCFVGVVAYISISYFLNFFDRNTLGITTELGMLLLLGLSFALGADLLDYRIIVGVTIIVSLISNLKVEFKHIIGSFSKREVLESLEFAALSAVILPWLPNVSITLQTIASLLNISAGDWGSIVLVNPFQLGVVVVFISSLNFAGYFLAKMLQSSSSILLTAFIGGLVSSTSVTQFLAAKSKSARPGTVNLLTGALLLANMTSFVRIPLIVLALNAPLFIAIAPAMALMVVLTLTITFVLQRRSKVVTDTISLFRSPLALKPAIQFGLLFVIVTIITNVGTKLLGNAGFVATAIIASLSGLDAISVITSNSAGKLISMGLAAAVLIGAVLTNLIFKMIIISLYSEKKFRNQSVLWLSVITVAGGIFLIVNLL